MKHMCVCVYVLQTSFVAVFQFGLVWLALLSSLLVPKYPEATSQIIDLEGGLILFINARLIAQACCLLTLTFKFIHNSYLCLPTGLGAFS